MKNEKIEKVSRQLKANDMNWSDFARKLGKDPRNFKRTLEQNLDKIDGWLLEIGLTSKIESKND